MKAGISYRDVEVTSPRGNQLRLHVEHITDMAHPNLCLIKYSVTSLNYSGKISFVPILDGHIVDDNEQPGEKSGISSVQEVPMIVHIFGRKHDGKMRKYVMQ